MLSKHDMAMSKIALHATVFIALSAQLRFETQPDEHFSGLGLPCTAYTDGQRVVLAQSFMDSLELSEVIGLYLHEVGHNMLAHMARLGDRDITVAQVAWDIVLNQSLEDYFRELAPVLAVKLPPNGIYGPEYNKYKGWNWEKVYADLMQQKKQGKDPAAGKPGFDNVLPNKNKDGSAMTPEDQNNVAKKWTMAAQQAMAEVKKRKGSLPGVFADIISELATPKVDWRSQVWDACTRAAAEDRSWNRFNRRFLYQEQYLQGRWSEKFNLIAQYVDTSASMDSKAFKLAMGCLNEVFEQLNPENIMLGQCDTRMVSEEMLTCDDLPLTVHGFKGRGGTELSPMFEHVRSLETTPDLMIVVTDGEFNPIRPELQPDCPVVWIVTTKEVQAAQRSFGTVIEVQV